MATAVIVDLETLGLKIYSPLLTIGACAIDLETGNELHFEQHILLDAENVLQADPDTLLWWFKQSNAARMAIVNGQENAAPTKEALLAFAHWLAQLPTGWTIWGNNAEFDLGKLKYHAALECIQTPWNYRQERCYRTLNATYGHLITQAEDARCATALTKHVALDDAIYEARRLCLILNRTLAG